MSLVETGLAFAEGLALIVSPCILPVLPLVLSASADGGRKRPFGIIVGFVTAFTAFVLLSRQLVVLSGIDPNIITYGSLILLALFGLVLLSGKLSAGFSAVTARLAGAGNRLSSSSSSAGGFTSGILIGMLIGLVWTPCAGPILAAVLVQVIRQQSDIQAVFQVAAFALGAGFPMLVISLTGRKIMSRLGFFTTHAEAVRKAFGVVILLSVGFIASGASTGTLASEQETEKSIAAVETSAGLLDPLAAPYPAPELAGIQGWINRDPFTLQSLRGKVVLVDFWTYSCINCVRTLPYITQWDEKYRDKGLVIVGVHAPEFEFEKSRANVESAVAAHGIRYPVVLDNNLDTWTKFHNRYWPAHYLIDKNGQVVYTHFGEGHYARTEHNIRYLLGLGAQTDATEKPSPSTSRGQTPETYLGSARAKNFSGAEQAVNGDVKTFDFPPELAVDHWALSGDWEIESERIVSYSPGAALRLHFNAGKVFVVLGTPEGKQIRATVTLDGKPLSDVAGKDAPGGTIIVRGHGLYEIVRQGKVGPGVLEIAAEDPGLEAYAFTFGK